MAKVQAVWIGGSGDWDARLHWNDGKVPNNNHPVRGDTYEVTLPRSTAYTVTISAGENFTVDSVAITDPLATLAVDGSSSTQTSLTVTSTSSGTFNNTGTLALNNYATVSIDGGFVNSGTLDVDSFNDGVGGFDTGGSSLAIGAKLNNSGAVNIGNFGLSEPTTVTASGLSNTGTINLLSTGSALVTLDITGAAPATLGDINIQGDVLLEFGSGAVGGIALDTTFSLADDPTPISLNAGSGASGTFTNA
jgi:hypothetical protein